MNAVYRPLLWFFAPVLSAQLRQSTDGGYGYRPFASNRCVAVHDEADLANIVRRLLLMYGSVLIWPLMGVVVGTRVSFSVLFAFIAVAVMVHASVHWLIERRLTAGRSELNHPGQPIDEGVIGRILAGH